MQGVKFHILYHSNVQKQSIYVENQITESRYCIGETPAPFLKKRGKVTGIFKSQPVGCFLNRKVG